MKMLITVCCTSLLVGCATKSSNPSDALHGVILEERGNSPQVEVLQGVVLEKRANTKSYAAWNAPSYVYYVLDLGDVIVTLRPSQRVSTADLQRLKGKRVSVCGHHVEGKTYQPQKGELYPMDGARPAKRGSGFVVTEIIGLKE